jgi:thiol-disulfide isomerase/thioredoxin
MVDPSHEYNHDTCPACAGHGQVATSDGFAACASCSGKGAWAPPASCCAADGGRGHGKGGGCEIHGATDGKPKPRLRSHGAVPAANMRELLTRVDLEDEDGNLLDAASAFERKVVLLYFASAACPACARFSPHLARLASSHARDLVVVYVGGDRTEAEAEGPHTRGRGFLRVPWRSVHREVLLQSYRVFAIPQVVVYQTVTTWGHTAISVNPGKCVDAWKRGETGYSLLEMLTPSSCSGSGVSAQAAGYAK